MMHHCCVPWGTSHCKISTTIRLGKFPRVEAPERKGHSHAQHRGSSSGIRCVVEAPVCVLLVQESNPGLLLGTEAPLMTPYSIDCYFLFYLLRYMV